MAESFCKKAVNNLVGRHITEGRWSRTRRQEKGSDSLHMMRASLEKKSDLFGASRLSHTSKAISFPVNGNQLFSPSPPRKERC